MDLPVDDSVYSWEMVGNEARSVLLALEETHLKQEQGPFDVNDILDMEFFKEEQEAVVREVEVPANSHANTPVAASAPWSPEIRKKKQKVAPTQPCTYPRPSQRKNVQFSTLRDSPPLPRQKKTFWYNNKLKAEAQQQASAPFASPQTPEIVVTFPLLNLKASTATLPSPTAPQAAERAVKLEEDMDILQPVPPHSYFFDPRTQPFYYPSSCPSPAASVAGQAHYQSEQAPRFHLLEQPSSRQRKSYKNENRYIVPNPLTVCAKTSPDLPHIVRGVVSVKLVDRDGNPVVSEKGNILESVDGSLSQPLYGPNLSTDFSLKVLQTSQGNMFRLLFTVSYVVENVGNCEEKIYSRPFVVHSNRRKNSKEKPIVVEMKPASGPSSGGTEVWIKGIGFSEKVVVTFGDQNANIVESNENLLVVAVPPIADEDRVVPVSVSNKYAPNEFKNAEKALEFRYKSSSSERMETEEHFVDMFEPHYLHENAYQ